MHGFVHIGLVESLAAEIPDAVSEFFTACIDSVRGEVEVTYGVSRATMRKLFFRRVYFHRHTGEILREGVVQFGRETWALAASRVADWLETEPLADTNRLAVIGLSRLGKTALWAGATDTRFSMVCPNCSGLFGARMATRNLGGETIDQITSKFPHWFAPQCREKWCGKDWELPFDQHWLLGAIAPRLLAVGSADLDWWACPSAEFCSWECSRGAFPIRIPI